MSLRNVALQVILAICDQQRLRALIDLLLASMLPYNGRLILMHLSYWQVSFSKRA